VCPLLRDLLPGPGHGPDRRLQGGEFKAANVDSGSASDSHSVEITAEKLTSKLSDRIADVRGQQ